jgi:Putative Actinobacterial Holin-X, holin superfamily III
MTVDSRGLSDRSVADLLKQASDQTTTLVRQELALAKAELTTKGKQVGLGARMFGGAGVFGVYAFGALTAAIILALGLALTAWLAALIVGVAYGAVAYGAVAGGLALQGNARSRPAPRRCQSRRCRA